MQPIHGLNVESVHEMPVELPMLSDPEYCLFWLFQSDVLCMSQDAWASWAEAIGTLIGLAIAIGVPVYIHRVEMERARKAAEIVEKVTLARIERRVQSLIELAPGLHRMCMSFPQRVGLRTHRLLKFGDSEYLKVEMPNLHLLGEMKAVPVARFFAAVLAHNDVYDTNAAIIEGDWNDPESFSSAFGEGALTALRKSADVLLDAARVAAQAMGYTRPD